MSYGNQPGDAGGLGYPPGEGYPPPASGYGYPPPYGYRPPSGPGTNGMAVASLVLGAAGLILCGIPGILGVIFGHVALNQVQRTGEQGRGLALAGLIVSYAGIAIWILYAVGLGLLAALSAPNIGY